MSEDRNYLEELSPTASMETLLACAEEASAGLSPRVRTALDDAMAEYFQLCVTPTGVELEKKADPREHRSTTIARLCFAGLTKPKAEELYKNTLTLFSDRMSTWVDKLESITEPFIDSLTFTMRNVHHSPAEVFAFLEQFVAPANETLNGWSWRVSEGGNKHYGQRVNVFHNDLFFFSVFFDLKTETEDLYFAFIDCTMGHAQETWDHFKSHVDELDIAISRVDSALDVHSLNGFEILLNTCQAKRMSWFESVKPKYSSINLDNPTQGRTFYMGYIPKKQKGNAKGTDPAKAAKKSQGAKAGTFTVRGYDKGVEILQSHGRDALAALDDDQIRNYARIECSSAPGTPEEKREMARNLAESNAAAWGFRAFTQDLYETLTGSTVDRVQRVPEPVKGEDERMKSHFERFKRFYHEMFEGENVMKLLHALHEYCGVRMDVFAVDAQAPKPDDERSEEFLAFIEYSEQESYDGTAYKAAQQRDEEQHQAHMNSSLRDAKQSSETWQERRARANDQAVTEALTEAEIAAESEARLRAKWDRLNASILAGLPDYVRAAATEIEDATGETVSVFGILLERSLGAQPRDIAELTASCHKLCPGRDTSLLGDVEEGQRLLAILELDEELFDELTTVQHSIAAE